MNAIAPRIRADRLTVTGQPRRLDSGGMVYPVIFASAGVYDYPEHGFAELVGADVLSDRAFVEALVGLPVIVGDTQLHWRGVEPGGSLEQSRVGTILRAEWSDAEQAIIGEIVIDEAPGLEAIADGTRGVSIRYEVLDSVDEVGTHGGKRYTRRQTGRTRPNHLILAPRGRDPRARIAADMELHMDEILKLLRERADADGGDLMRSLIEMMLGFRDDAMKARAEADGYMAERDRLAADMAAMKPKADADGEEMDSEEDEADAMADRADARPIGPIREALALAERHGVQVADDATVATIRRAVVARVLGAERADALDDGGLAVALDIIGRSPRADAYALTPSSRPASSVAALMTLE